MTRVGVQAVEMRGISRLEEDIELLEESAEEAKEYDERIKEEIKWKIDLDEDEDQERIFQPLSEIGEEGQEEALSSRYASQLTLLNDPTPVSPGDADKTIEFPVLSFRPSNIAHSTPKPLGNTATTSTFPQVPTPTFISTPQLPQPPIPVPTTEAGPSRTKPRTPRVIDTPDHIPSPVDTPISFRPVPGQGEGRGRRDDPATPVPLGVEKFNALKSKKDFQTLTKHFEMFTKQAERQNAASSGLSGIGAGAGVAKVKAIGKGKGKAQAKEVAALGGKVFEGLRFCFPPELGNTSKQKTHWDIVRLVLPAEDVYFVDVPTTDLIDCQARGASNFTARHGRHTRYL